MPSVTFEGGQNLDEDEDHDGQLEELRSGHLDLALQELVCAADEPDLRLDALAPLRDAEAEDGGAVDTCKIEVADRLDRIVHPLGELGELHETAEHVTSERAESA